MTGLNVPIKANQNTVMEAFPQTLYTEIVVKYRPIFKMRKDAGSANR